MRYAATLFGLFLLANQVLANHDNDYILSADDWKEVMDKVMLLEDSGLMSTVLPWIMRNRDALKLTNSQLSAFHSWWKENYVNTVNLMDLIVEKKIRFSIESLSPDITNDHLLASQNEIQALQQELLKLELSCREIVMATFTKEQWESLAFIAVNNPKLSSLVSRRR